jgi:anti-sigma-K factor RskA
MSEREGMTESHDCGGEAAAYVLGALEPYELEAFERHLEGCAVCRDEVEALRGVVDALPMAAPQHAAPRKLRRRLMRAVREEPKPGKAWGSAAWRGPLRATPRAVIGSLAAAAAVAGGVVAGIELTGGQATRVVQARVVGLSGSAQLRLAGGRAELIVHHLPPPPPDRIYEVWVKAPHGLPAPIGVLFSVTSSGSADVGLPSSLQGIKTVMVTPEPLGGSAHPTHSPVIIAQLT